MATIPAYNAKTGATTGKPSAEYDAYLKSLNKKITPNQPVDNSLLKGGTDLTMINPKPALGAVGMGEELAQTAQANQDQYTQDLANKSKTAETQKSTALEDYFSGLTGQKGETQIKDEAYKNTVDPVDAERIAINQQIFSEQQGVRRKLEELDKNPQGLFGGALADEKNRIQNDSLKKQADLSVIQMGIQGRYDSAKAIADRAIQVQLEKQKNAVEALRLNYEDKKDLFTKAEQREFETKQADRERELKNKENFMTDIYNLAIDAQKGGYPSSVVDKILKSKDRAEAISILSRNPIPSSGGFDAPTVKTINGVDMQWNTKTGNWEPITAEGNVQATQKSLDQIAFLRQTASEANSLANKAGWSGVRKTAGDIFQGDTGFRQLEAKTNTLRVNVMALMTDPTIKKFFGPQMSNADVALMTSAGTTLNPDSNSSKQMREELRRLDELFGRMQASVQTGGSSGGNVIIAPNGEEIIITD